MGRPARRCGMVGSDPRSRCDATPQSKTEDGEMESYYLGLDVHSRESVFVIEDQSGARRGRTGTIRPQHHLLLSAYAQTCGPARGR